ncbi:uncharacterized protein LOC109503694 [Harpegnathos saltator]|uniref:uncharacterized protein LOC109503694 n=1 Tax=Harpegnathos saltator TaxID=610380 RepID=UPI000DBEE0F6|nr:uncharacterized protein LOC109503694 [Harpegnathos saltator]
MPSCCIKNCKSRTFYTDKKNITFFRFPKEKVILEKWINACGKSEDNIKINSDTNCDRTQPKSTKTCMKQMKRLKEGSIPTKMLLLDKSRKRRNKKEQYQIVIMFLIEQCIQENIYSEEDNFDKQNSLISLNDVLRGNEYVFKPKKSGNYDVFEMLLQKLRCFENENKKLLQENKQLKKKNEQLNTQVEQLQTSVMQNASMIQVMEIDKRKEANKIVINTLRKVLTLGQVKSIMSPNNIRKKWLSEDISAIALRSLSPKAYRYLRNIKKMPLPCESPLQNWVASFSISPGILKDVLRIMHDKGYNLSTVEKLTILSFDELYVSNKLDLERKEQKVYGLHKTCQFVMARGLFNTWKQPIYYNFDESMKCLATFYLL